MKWIFKQRLFNDDPESVDASATSDALPPKVAEVIAKERQAARQAAKEAKEQSAKAKELEAKLAAIEKQLEEFGGLETVAEAVKTKASIEQTVSEREKALQEQVRQAIEDGNRKMQQLREQQALSEQEKARALQLVEETEIRTAIKEALIANHVKPDNMDLLLDSRIIRQHVKFFNDDDAKGVYPVDATKYPLLDPENPSNNMSLETWVRINVVPKRKDLFAPPVANGDGMRGRGSGRAKGMSWDDFNALSGSQALSVARSGNRPKGK